MSLLLKFLGATRSTGCRTLARSNVMALRSSAALQAGHSKWANIKHDKAINDRKRNTLFTKISSAIQAAARAGGIDPAKNPALNLQISRAKASNMPKDRIAKAVEASQGAQQGEQVEEMTFEGTGPKGSAIVVQCLSTSRNRIVQFLRHVLDKNGGQMASENAIKWMFERRGVLVFNIPIVKLDDIMEIALKFDVIDVTISHKEDFSDLIDDDEEEARTEQQARKSQRLPIELEEIQPAAVPRAGDGVASMVINAPPRPVDEIDALEADIERTMVDDVVGPQRPTWVMIKCPESDVHYMGHHFAKSGYAPISIDVIWDPTQQVTLRGDVADATTDKGRFAALLDAVDDLDDVQRVFHNVK